MYGWIWRHLPGDTSAKALLSLLLVLVTIGVLLLVVFPWVEVRLPASSVTVGS